MSLPQGHVPKDFPVRLRTALRLLDLSQTDLARGVEATAQSVSAWCRRKRGTVPSRLYLKAIDAFISLKSAKVGAYLRGETDVVPALVVRS